MHISPGWEMTFIALHRFLRHGLLVARRLLLLQVRKVRTLKNKIINDQQDILIEKMTKAEHKRQLMLKEKIKKAQVEEAKVSCR